MPKTVYDMEVQFSANDKDLRSKAKRLLDTIRKIGDVGREVTIGAKWEAGLIAPTKKAVGLYQALEEAKAKAEELERTLENLKDAGASPEAIEQTEKSLAEATEEAGHLERQIQSMSMYGKGGKFMDTAPASIIADMKAYAATAKNIVGGLGEEITKGLMEASPGFAKIVDGYTKIRNGIADAAYHATHFGKGVINDARGIASRLGKIPGIQRVISKLFGGMARSAGKVKNAVTPTLKSLLNLAAVGTIAFSAFKMAKEGMENLIQYDSRTENSVNQLKAALLTLKNALATAFAPVLNAVAPILSTLINMLSRAATAVAHFMAAITGQKSVVVAKKVNAGYASSLGKTASGANKANKANKALQRTLMGFDKINRLEAKDNGSGGGGGAGGAGGAGGIGDMFDTVPIDRKIADFAKKIKDAWKKGDFTEIGQILANKLNAAMEAIPWKKINKTAKKIATCIGTFINGFVETFNWKLLGRTISNGLLVAFNFLSTLLETIHWQSIGKAIVDFISGIRWGALFKASARLLGNIVGAIAGVFAGAAKEIGKKIKGYFKKSMKDAGGNVVKGLFLGIKNAIKGVATFIKNNIFKPFINGFKKAFGISSPSKEMKTQGEYMIDGLLEGLKGKLKDIIDWFKDLPGKLQEEIKEKIEIGVGLVKNFGSGITTVAGYVGQFMGGAVTKGIGLVKDFGSGIATVYGFVKQFMGDSVEKAIGLKTNFGDGVATVAGWVKKRLGKGVKKAIGLAKSGWSSVSSWVNDRMGGSLSKAISLAKDGWTTVKEWVKKKIGGTVSVGISLFKSGWKSIKSFFGLAGGGYVTKHGFKLFKEGGAYNGGRWQPIQNFAGGGYPNGSQMFVAREAGPELVGTIGGTTAVMNNDQIVASVSDGVAKAMANVMRQWSSGDKAVNVYLMGDAGKMFRVMRQEARDYTRATGQPAFPV